MLDLIFSIFILIPLIPFFLIVSILILIDSKGPVFFVQQRLGKNKEPFPMLKFRTMTHGVRKTETQVFADNPEITKVGFYLRRFKIDEMPQILNVLNGDMAVIGPRPCLPNTIEKYNLDDYRFKVKPGLSSIAGVNGSIFLSWQEKWWYDKFYVENLSFGLDLKIFFKTFLVIILGEEKFLKKPKIKENENS